MFDALVRHWPEYLIEASLLGAFMVSACLSVALLEHPASPARKAVCSGGLRRALIGVLMGLTAVALIYSPWGARSGAHMNPAFTLAFWSLGKIAPADAAWYVIAQFAGGALGVLLCRVVLPNVIAHESVAHVVTLPGRRGRAVAWIGEFVISGALMGVVLVMTNRADAAPFTGLVAGVLIAAYIAIEAPLSGMSMNPARTLGSALVAGEYKGLWIYFTAPTAAMAITALVFAAVVGGDHVLCGKLNHRGDHRCIFRCHIDRLGAAAPDAGPFPSPEAEPNIESGPGPSAGPTRTPAIANPAERH